MTSSSSSSNVNPFYISPDELEQEWQGDYEWGDDDDDEDEQEGLLRSSSASSANNNHHQQRSSLRQQHHANNNNSSRHVLPHHVRGGKPSGGQRRWVCTMGIVTLVFFLLLSLFSSSSSNDEKNDVAGGGDVTSNVKNATTPSSFDNDDTGNEDAPGDAIRSEDDSHASDNDKKDNEDHSTENETEPADKTDTSADAAPSSSSSLSAAADAVHRVVLLGERQTGVDAFRKHWADCFPDRNFTTVLNRKTVWFQNLTHPPQALLLADDDENNSNKKVLFVFMVRNPYTWVEAMRGHPTHMSAHVNSTTTPHLALGWPDFVSKPWTTTRVTDSDSESSSGANDASTVPEEEMDGAVCQLGFAPNQVIPCHVAAEAEASADADIYELKPAAAGVVSNLSDAADSLVFANILELRAAKLKHFVHDLPLAYQERNLLTTIPISTTTTTSTSGSIINNVLIIHYEDDLQTSMQKLEQVTGWQPVETCRNAQRLPPAVTLENLDADYIQHLSQSPYMDWELEGQIGYQKL